MKVAIAGCAGRMGQVLVKKILATPGMDLTSGSERIGNKLAGNEVGSVVQMSTPGVLITTDPEKLFIKADAVIDFTTPEYSLLLGELAAKHKKILVCGTTALLQEGVAVLKKTCKKSHDCLLAQYERRD